MGRWPTLVYLGHSQCPPGIPSPWGTGAVHFLSEKHLERFGPWQGYVSWGWGTAERWVELETLG